MRDTEKILIKVSKIEEHLRALNGTVARHEKEMNTIERDLTDNKIMIAKLTTYAVFGSAAGAFLANIIFKFIF